MFSKDKVYSVIEGRASSLCEESEVKNFCVLKNKL